MVFEKLTSDHNSSPAQKFKRLFKLYKLLYNCALDLLSWYLTEREDPAEMLVLLWTCSGCYNKPR